MELIVKNLDAPDERPALPRSSAALVHVGDTVVVRGQIEPGWRWSNDWRPLFGGAASCQMPHRGVVLSGRMHFEMDDGSSVDLGPGDVYSIPPGHDAWVVGDEPARSIDWAPADDHATNEAIDAAKDLATS